MLNKITYWNIATLNWNTVLKVKIILYQSILVFVWLEMDIVSIMYCLDINMEYWKTINQYHKVGKIIFNLIKGPQHVKRLFYVSDNVKYLFILKISAIFIYGFPIYILIGMRNLCVSCSLVCIILLSSCLIVFMVGFAQKQVPPIVIVSVLYILAGNLILYPISNQILINLIFSIICTHFICHTFHFYSLLWIAGLDNHKV